MIFRVLDLILSLLVLIIYKTKACNCHIVYAKIKILQNTPIVHIGFALNELFTIFLAPDQCPLLFCVIDYSLTPNVTKPILVLPFH